MSFSPIDKPAYCGSCLETKDIDMFAHLEKHTYCGGCLRAWVQLSPTCPSCRADINTTNLVGHQVIFEDKGDVDFEFPRRYAKYGIPAAIGIASLFVYDAVANVNPAVIGLTVLAFGGVFAQAIHPDFDQHGQSMRG